MGFYMEGLILGVNTMYMLFCFFKLFRIGLSIGLCMAPEPLLNISEVVIDTARGRSPRLVTVTTEDILRNIEGSHTLTYL